MKPAKRSKDHFVAPPRVLIFVGLFLLVFAGVGAWAFFRSLIPFTWKSEPCSVSNFILTENPSSKTPFGADVEYRFEHNGSRHNGNKLGLEGWANSRDQIEYQLKFKAGQITTCYFPRGKPERAVLIRPPIHVSGLALIGFAVAIGWILFIAHRYRDEDPKLLGQKTMPVVGLFFGTPGLALLLFLSLPVWIETIQARFWKETPATVCWSEIRVSNGRRSSTNYRANICYEYHANGRAWRQNHIFPGDIHSGNSRSAHRLVAEHRPGQQITCLVNPDKPQQSLISPNIGWMFFLTIFPLPFLAVGALALRACFVKNKPKKR